MEQPQPTGDAYSGFSPLMSSILELTREIENLDDEPLVREPRKVLWAKKRFPRQGIRCRATTSSKRRKYIGATARDFPSLMLSKSVLPIRIPAAIPVERPPQVNEILSERKREGSAETRQETDSSASDPDPAAKNLGNGTQTSTASRDDAENLSSNNNDENNVYCADGYMIGDKIHTSINDAEDSSPDLVDSGVWYNGTHSRGDDDSSNRAINVTGDEEEDADSTYSSYSTRNDEISVEYLGNPTVSPHERVKYVIVSENYYQVNSALDCHDYHSNVTMNGSEIDASTTKSFKSVCSKRKPGRPRKHKGMKNKQDKQNELAQPGPSSQDSGSGRSSAKRSKTTKVKGSETCRAGKRCFGCTDSSPVDTPASTNVGTRDLASSSRSLTAKQKPKPWTKNDWDNFFCVFSAVAAEAHTLQSLGSNNTAANKRWLQCMRTVLQKPPF